MRFSQWYITFITSFNSFLFFCDLSSQVKVSLKFLEELVSVILTYGSHVNLYSRYQSLLHEIMFSILSFLIFFKFILCIVVIHEAKVFDLCNFIESRLSAMLNKHVWYLYTPDENCRIYKCWVVAIFSTGNVYFAIFCPYEYSKCLNKLKKQENLLSLFLKILIFFK